MDKEETWEQFWSSGKVEDYLKFSMCEGEKEGYKNGAAAEKRKADCPRNSEEKFL